VHLNVTYSSSVIIIIVFPSLLSLTIKSSISSFVLRSKEPVGSYDKIISEGLNNILAKATLYCSPPDNE
jgi:hypothetical protein